MAVHSYGDLRAHVGHRLVCACYGSPAKPDPASITLECVTCNEILVDFEKPEGFKSGLSFHLDSYSVRQYPERVVDTVRLLEDADRKKYVLAHAKKLRADVLVPVKDLSPL